MVRTRSQATSGVCLVTMARDEGLFLTHWLWHYSQALDAPGFLILDDGSAPGTIEAACARVPAADVQVIRLPDGPFDVQYKANALSALATVAVERHAVVIASDADEIVMPVGAARARPLFDLLMEAPAPFAAPVGVSVIHDVAREAPFDPLRPVAAQRRIGRIESAFTKPAIWKGESWLFGKGQHTLVERPTPVAPSLALVHLRLVDVGEFARRQAVRNTREISTEQFRGRAQHWQITPEAALKIPEFRAPPAQGAVPRLEPAIPEFLERFCKPIADGYAIRDLDSRMMVEIDTCL
ncbi:glycosyltransferase family 2 protein [Roseicyclus mahoneyensis]|uniref:Glycosyl transferase family 2 n=1 Tax=Roseicyclus mahoneyensis TaxID=164332 RepID=A0A316GIG6_9RHOB|nr:glycosyltransferase family 2 protein [Roseicyclus mahoneyensis]PWK60824.1 glycosyl transferase family 2 [Roseicyclus mahoneyensis]